MVAGLVTVNETGIMIGALDDFWNASAIWAVYGVALAGRELGVTLTVTGPAAFPLAGFTLNQEPPLELCVTLAAKVAGRPPELFGV